MSINYSEYILIHPFYISALRQIFDVQYSKTYYDGKVPSCKNHASELSYGDKIHQVSSCKNHESELPYSIVIW